MTDSALYARTYFLDASARKELGKTGFEGAHDVANTIAECHDRFHNRLTLNQPRFVDRYIKSKLNLLIRFLHRGHR
jgi:hypothetical protein